MAIFDELRAGYRASQDRYRDYARASLAAAHSLARDFRDYIGAPETYADPEDDTRRPYVRLLAFQLQDGMPVAAPAESHDSILARDEDGFWRFAISLTLDRDDDAFPKQTLGFFLRLKLADGVSHVQLLDDGYKDFRFAPDGPPDKTALFEHMVEMVKRVLDARPWEGVEKLPIGFELHPPKPPFDEEDPTLLEAP